MDYCVKPYEFADLPIFTDVVQLSFQARTKDHSTRKRKIDKDGFVKPLTPDLRDISQMSRQYEPRSDKCEDRAGVYSVPVKFSDGEDEPRWGDWKQGDTVEVNCTPAQSKQPKKDSSIKKAGAGDDANKQNLGEQSVSVETEIKELAKQYQTVMHKEWLPLFKESEEFELMCPTRLDNLIRQAEDIEKTLGQQKDVICNRLQGLGKTLHV